MRKTLLMAAICSISSMMANAQVWVPQATAFTPVSSGVFNVSVCDSNTVWISAYDGSGGGATVQDFSRTTDGGATWTAGTVPVGANYGWSMIHGFDANTAWAMFYNTASTATGQIWKTTDGGVTWTQQGAGTIYNTSGASFPNVIHFWDANVGMAMGDPVSSEYEIYTTTDGGTTWTAVPGANIPPPVAGEYGIVGHYDVSGDTIWFDTNKGRVYRSVDKGLNWTVAATGITVPTNQAIDICFTNSLTGVARLYNATTGANNMRVTADGGDTWTAATPVGNFFGSDLESVPGTNRMVSTGAATGFIGSSYSDDGGLNWTTIETIAQRTALGIWDSTTMWAGGFTTSPTSGGIFKYTIIPTVTCADAGITAGTATVNDTIICFGDTLRAQSTGVFAPTVGDFAGSSWVISTADISGTSDPLNEPTAVAFYGFVYPAPATTAAVLINDGTFIGTSIPYGIYYWTPLVFGNATAATNPPQFLNDLILDVNCTFGGNSVLADVRDPSDPYCTTLAGINQLSNVSLLSVYPVVKSESLLDLQINASEYDKANVQIIDITGRSVVTSQYYVTKGTNHQMIDISKLATGTYIIKVETTVGKATAKLVKL